MPNDRRRHPRPASAVPTAVNPDDELSIPITVAEIQQSDTMPPPLMEQLARVVEMGEGLWPLRRQIERIESAVAGIAKATTRHDALIEEMLAPQLQQWRATTDELAQQLPRMLGAVDQLAINVKALEGRVRDMEFEVRTLSTRFSAHEDRVGKLEASVADNAKRITSLETSALVASTTSAAISSRDKWWIAKLSAAVGLAAAVVPWAIRFVINHF